MRIWRMEEQTEYPDVAMAVVLVWTPAGWGASKGRAWVSHAGEAMRSMFPNVPETLEGPWGSLSRDKVFGADEACSAMLDAIDGLSVSQGGLIDPAFEKSTATFFTQSVGSRVEEGKLKMIDLVEGSLGSGSQVAVITIEPEASFYAGLDKRAGLVKIDMMLEGVGDELRRWMPTLAPLAHSARLSRHDMSLAMALAAKQAISRGSPAPAARSARRAGL